VVPPAPTGPQPSQEGEDDESLYLPSVDEGSSLYEPPGSEPSSGYVSPGCSDDPDLEPEAETPSPAVTHAGSDTE
jgi:hypothetical protein